MADVARNADDPVELDLATVLDGLAGWLRTEYPEATVELPDTDATVTANPQLLRALRELGENAVKYGGDDPVVRVAVEAGEDCVSVHVTDDGPGLPEMERRVLRSGRELPTDHSQGLGLWLVNWTVTESGGQVEVEVTDDGTTVTLRLSAATAAVALGDATTSGENVLNRRRG